MRILVLTPYLSQSGGVANYYNTIELNEHPGIEYFFVNKQNTKSVLEKAYYAIFIYLKFIIIAIRYQLIHINPSLNFKSFYRDMIFILISRLLFKKVLIFFRGWEDGFEKTIQNSRLISLLFRHTYAKADRYIVLSEHFKRKLINMGVKSDKPFYIETTVANSSKINKFDIDKKLNSINKNINFLFISRVVKEKGIYIAIDAFTKARNELSNMDMNFYIAGDGEELQYVKKYVQDNNLKGIQFTGLVSGDAKFRLLEQCHIMLFPTYYGEGLPNCLLEGMLYGMPIISRINAGIPDIVDHGINGFLTDSLDSDVFKEFLLTILEDRELYKKMALANKHKAEKLFTKEKVKKRIINIYHDIL